MAAPLLHGLPPVVDARACTLILGNMPSAMSLSTNEYYGNPRNGFWRVTGEIFGFEPRAPYQVRTAALRAHGVAVWDVLGSCRRVGSLDSSVEPDSMVANDFERLFAEYPAIDRVYFNGAAAEKNYARLVLPRIGRPCAYQRLPSTSPAHTLGFTEKLAAWRAIRDVIADL
jgi:hypoxanthine-DNA glycosylase